MVPSLSRVQRKLSHPHPGETVQEDRRLLSGSLGSAAIGHSRIYSVPESLGSYADFISSPRLLAIRSSMNNTQIRIKKGRLFCRFNFSPFLAQVRNAPTKPSFCSLCTLPFAAKMQVRRPENKKSPLLARYPGQKMTVNFKIIKNSLFRTNSNKHLQFNTSPYVKQLIS